MKKILCCTFLLVALAGSAPAADITSMGDWSETLTAANLVAGAGSDLSDHVESISGVTILTISNAPGAWSLRVRRSSSQWDNNVILYAKRTSGGSGSGSISGGDSYVELTGSDSELFSGAESRAGIALQFKLTGLARNLPPATYLSSIIFTVQ